MVLALTHPTPFYTWATLACPSRAQLAQPIARATHPRQMGQGLIWVGVVLH